MTELSASEQPKPTAFEKPESTTSELPEPSMLENIKGHFFQLFD